MYRKVKCVVRICRFYLSFCIYNFYLTYLDVLYVYPTTGVPGTEAPDKITFLVQLFLFYLVMTIVCCISEFFSVYKKSMILVYMTRACGTEIIGL